MPRRHSDHVDPRCGKKGKAMLNKKCFGAVILAAVAVSPSAFAGDRGTNTAVGAVLGAAIGGSAGGGSGALIGGVLGAAVGNSIGGHDGRRHYDNRGYASVNYYQPAPVYVQPRPVYYEQPRYYREPAVVYVAPRGGYRHGGYDRGYERGHGRGHDGWDRDGRGGRDWDRDGRGDRHDGYRR
jgi:hypothetical protein